MMMFNVLSVFSFLLLLPFILAQEQGPIFVPFGWNKVPATARVIASSAGTTTYGLIDGGFAPGPATLVQTATTAASMFYVNSAQATPTTLSGVCNLASPIAMCTLNVFESGAPLPNSSGTSRPGNTSGGSSGSVGTSTGAVLTMTTLALGFCLGLAFLR